MFSRASPAALLLLAAALAAGPGSSTLAAQSNGHGLQERVRQLEAELRASIAALQASDELVLQAMVKAEHRLDLFLEKMRELEAERARRAAEPPAATPPFWLWAMLAWNAVVTAALVVVVWRWRRQLARSLRPEDLFVIQDELGSERGSGG